MSLVVGVQVAEDDAGQAAFKAAKGFGAGITSRQALAVIRLPEAVHADLRHRDAVEGGVELAVA